MKTQLPRDLTSRLSLPWFLRGILWLLLFLVRILGIYRYPHIHDPEVESLPNGLYTVYKSRKPMERGAKGLCMNT